VAKELTPAELKRATERVEDAFLATGSTLERLTKQRGVAPMLRLIEQAHADLERKVRNLGKPGETFTEVQRQALLAQYRAMMVQLQPRMVRTLGEASREAQIAGIRDLVKLVALGEAEFEGVVTPLPLEQAARMAGIIDADRASLLRQHEVSIRTYGVQSIGEAEQFLAQSFMQAKGYAETTSALLSMVEGSRYRAERIVRTETSFAYNAAHATAIDDASELVDGLMRRWTEYVDDATGRPLDARVANDSLVLHGQVCFQPEGATFEGRSTFLVGGTGGFTMPPDGRVNAKLWGRRYAHPPNRPNDRSRLVPWKPTWGVPAYMVVNGVRMDVRKALALMKGAEADEVLDVAEGEAMPEQKLASEDAVDASRAAFRREQERRNAEAAPRRPLRAPTPTPEPAPAARRETTTKAPVRSFARDEPLVLPFIEPRKALPAPRSLDVVAPPPPAPRKMTRKEYGDESRQYVESLTTAERQALAAYSEARYMPINNALRKGVTIPDVDNARETAQFVDSALAKAKPLDKTMVLERGLAAIWRNDEKVQLKVGDEYIDPAYVSTTAAQFQKLSSLFRRKDIHMRITVPAGVRVGFISAADPVRGKALLKSETEALLPRGLRFRVTSVKRKGPLKQLIDVEVVPE